MDRYVSVMFPSIPAASDQNVPHTHTSTRSDDGIKTIVFTTEIKYSSTTWSCVPGENIKPWRYGTEFNGHVQLSVARRRTHNQRSWWRWWYCRLEAATLGRLGIEGILDDARDFSVISRKYNVPNYSRSNQKITARLLVDDNSNASYVCVCRSKVEMCD